MRLAVREHRIRFAHAGALRADDFARTVPLILYHGHHRDADARIFEHCFRRLLVRRAAIDDDSLRQRPLSVRKSARKDLFQRRDIIIHFQS